MSTYGTGLFGPNGSKIEIVQGTTSSHGGPCTETCGHRQLPLDEVELMDPEVFKQAGELPPISRRSLPLQKPARRS